VKKGDVIATVDVDDLKIAYEIQRQFSGPGVSIDAELYRPHCQPGADIPAVAYRASMLLGTFMVASHLLGDKPTEKAFEFFAKEPFLVGCRIDGEVLERL